MADKPALSSMLSALSPAHPHLNFSQKRLYYRSLGCGTFYEFIIVNIDKKVYGRKDHGYF